MQNNAPSHAAHKTTEYIQQPRFSGPRKMKWSANSPDFNPIVKPVEHFEAPILRKWTSIQEQE